MPIQLAQVAGVIEARERPLHPPELGQGGLSRCVSGRFRSGEELEVDRLAHRPGPALDQPLVRKARGHPPHAARQHAWHAQDAGPQDPEKLAPPHAGPAGRASSRRTKNDCT